MEVSEGASVITRAAGLAISVCVALVCACAPAFADTITGNVVAIIDGDTLTVVDGKNKRYRIRLAEIDAPERKQAFGTRSRQSLSALCLKKEAQVEWRNKEANNRYVGRIVCAGIDAAAEQVRRGMAWVSPRFTTAGSPLYELESYARLRRAGLWGTQQAPVPPWEWRAANNR